MEWKVRSSCLRNLVHLHMQYVCAHVSVCVCWGGRGVHFRAGRPFWTQAGHHGCGRVCAAPGGTAPCADGFRAVQAVRDQRLCRATGRTGCAAPLRRQASRTGTTAMCQHPDHVNVSVSKRSCTGCGAPVWSLFVGSSAGHWLCSRAAMVMQLVDASGLGFSVRMCVLHVCCDPFWIDNLLRDCARGEKVFHAAGRRQQLLEGRPPGRRGPLWRSCSPRRCSTTRGLPGAPPPLLLQRRCRRRLLRATG